MDVLLYTDRRMVEHRPGPGHPERPDRLRAVLDSLEADPIPGTHWRTAPPAPRDALLRVHTPEHLARVEAARGRSVSLDPDTHTSPGSVEAGLIAAGCAIEAVEAVWSGPHRRAFCLVRPPGHHAEAAAAMGFCLFNNIAVAAAHATDVLGCERVLVVDWDVHHGNGTQHSFWDRRDVLFASSHQWPFYPGTGAAGELGGASARGYTLNLPLPPGVGDGDFLGFWEATALAAAERFRPQLVLVSAGFDAHARDPLGQLTVSTEGFAALCARLRDLADRCCEGRIALFLEGGYDLVGLTESARACVEVLGGAAAESAERPTLTREIAALRALHAPWWG